MSLGSTAVDSSSRTLVDSALAGSQDEASLFWTSVSLAANPEATTKTTIQAASDDPLGDSAGQPAGDLTMHEENSITRRGQSSSGYPLSRP